MKIRIQLDCHLFAWLVDEYIFFLGVCIGCGTGEWIEKKWRMNKTEQNNENKLNFYHHPKLQRKKKQDDIDSVQPVCVNLIIVNSIM